MLKKILISLIISFCLLSQGISSGLRVGLNQTSPSSFEGIPDQLQPEGAASFLAGLSLNIDLVLLSLDADVLYVDNKTKDAGKNTQLQIPVTAKLALLPTGVKPYLRGGVAYNHFLSAEDGDGNDIDDFDETLKNGLSIVLGGGVDLSLPIIPTLNIDARYIIPLYDSFEDSSIPTSVSTFKLNQIQVSVGFGF